MASTPFAPLNMMYCVKQMLVVGIVFDVVVYVGSAELRPPGAGPYILCPLHTARSNSCCFNFILLVSLELLATALLL